MVLLDLPFPWDYIVSALIYVSVIIGVISLFVWRIEWLWDRVASLRSRIGFSLRRRFAKSRAGYIAKRVMKNENRKTKNALPYKLKLKQANVAKPRLLVDEARKMLVMRIRQDDLEENDLNFLLLYFARAYHTDVKLCVSPAIGQALDYFGISRSVRDLEFHSTLLKFHNDFVGQASPLVKSQYEKLLVSDSEHTFDFFYVPVVRRPARLTDLSSKGDAVGKSEDFLEWLTGRVPSIPSYHQKVNYPFTLPGSGTFKFGFVRRMDLPVRHHMMKAIDSFEQGCTDVIVRAHDRYIPELDFVVMACRFRFPDLQVKKTRTIKDIDEEGKARKVRLIWLSTRRA